MARIKHHIALASRGFHEKIGRTKCLWSPFAALDYAVGLVGSLSCECKGEQAMQRTVFFSHGVFCACVYVCVCVCFCTLDRCRSGRVQAHCLRPLCLGCRTVIWLSANIDTLACAEIYNATACLLLFIRKTVEKSSFCI